MVDIVEYNDTLGSLDSSRTLIEQSRDDAMNWMDEYYQTPETASLVSENLDKLIDPTSKYMTDAQDASEKARSEQGYLDSGFNRGVGTVAALDNAFDVALEDTYVDVFNVSNQNEQYRQAYLSAYEIAMKAMTAQDELSFGEYGYSLIVDYMEETQANLLELQDKDFEYKDLLQTSKHEDNMDRLHLKHANDLGNRVLRNTTGLQSYYLESYANIIGSNIPQSNKYDQLVGLGYQIDTATTAAINQQYTNVGDNPYGITFIDNIPKYDQGDKTDEAFVWSVHDAKFEYVKVREVLDPLLSDIHGQTNHQERDASSLWYVLSDLVSGELNSIDKNSQLFVDKMEYFNRLKYDALGNDPTNDEIQSFFMDMYLIGKQTTIINQPTAYTNNDSFILIYPPHDELYHEWDSESESIIESVVHVDGNAAYYTDLYARYDNAINGGGWYGPAPDGYEEAKAACVWPNQWFNGQCGIP